MTRSSGTSDVRAVFFKFETQTGIGWIRCMVAGFYHLIRLPDAPPIYKNFLALINFRK